MKRLICYCEGGLGNRLRPIPSCQQLAEKSGRELFIFWEKSYRCNAYYNELFEGNLNFITKEEMYKFNSYTIYCSRWDANHIYESFGESLLKDLIEIHGTSSIGAHAMDLNDTKENVIIISNGFLTNTDMKINKQFFKDLIPVKEIQEKIDFWNNKLQLNTNIIGVSARGTDFNVGKDFYEYHMREGIKRNPNVQYLICSDDNSYCKYLLNKFPNNSFPWGKKNYAIKLDTNKESWGNNTLLSKEATIEGIIDMYLLSKTNFLIHPENSSFAEMIKIIQGF